MNDTKITVSTEELSKSTNARYLQMTSELAGIMSLYAAVNAELAHINDLAESSNKELQDASDDRLADFSIQISFGQQSIKVGLDCIDTYDAFCRFLSEAANNIDIYRPTFDSAK